jgi:integrase
MPRKRVLRHDRHVGAGYGGPEFLFSKTDAFPRYIDSHVRPLKLVQQKLGLRVLSHHKVGRHSVASQAVTGGESVKAVQAQLGHRSEQSTHQYAHLGSGPQRRLVEALRPARAPHERARHVNLASTETQNGVLRDAHVNVASTDAE